MTVLLLLAAALTAQAAEAEPLTVERAKELLPAAAGISNADFQKLSENPRPDAIESQSLTLVLLSLDPREAQWNPEAAKEFRYLGPGLPQPAALAKALAVSEPLGFASFLQPDYITDCTCEADGDRAEGTVTFESGLFAGRIPFVAARDGATWSVTEFRLPAYGVAVTRTKNGTWKREPIEKD